MIPATEPAPATRTRSPDPVHDTRGFWRILLAIVVPMPMLAKAVYYMVTPVAGDVTFEESVSSFEAHAGLLDTLKWFEIGRAHV